MSGKSITKNVVVNNSAYRRTLNVIQKQTIHGKIFIGNNNFRKKPIDNDVVCFFQKECVLNRKIIIIKYNIHISV